jgi:hypothetical protein
MPMSLCGGEEFVQTNRQSVELVVAGIVTEVSELPGPQHSPVPLGDMPCQSGVQHCCHYEGHNNGRGEEGIQDVVELIQASKITVRTQTRLYQFGLVMNKLE